eukprot:987719-Rhodomonas_salina.2
MCTAVLIHLLRAYAYVIRTPVLKRAYGGVPHQGPAAKLVLKGGFSHQSFLESQTQTFGYEFDVDYTETWEDALLATLRGTAYAPLLVRPCPVLTYSLAVLLWGLLVLTQHMMLRGSCH